MDPTPVVPPASSPRMVARQAICVTGMHRSGTSLTARAVNLLGVSFGAASAFMAPGDDNPAGYWENRSIKELDDELFGHLGGSWDQPPVLDPGWEQRADLDGFRARAADILKHDYGAAEPSDEPIGWKEPRLCLLLPFWRTVIDVSTTVVVVRHPVEVAASLSARNGIEVAQAAALWMRHILAALDNDQGALVVQHRALVWDPEAGLAAIAGHLGLPAPTPQIVDTVRRHIDPDLDHHQAGGLEPEPEHLLMALALEVWNGGEIDVTAMPEVVATAVSRGWLGAPASREALGRSRAEVVRLRDQLRRRKRAALAAAAEAATNEHAGPVAGAVPGPVSGEPPGPGEAL